MFRLCFCIICHFYHINGSIFPYFCKNNLYNPVLKGNKTLVRSIVLGVAVLLISIFISKKLSSPKAGIAPKISFRENVVPVKPANYEVHQVQLNSSGRVKALDRMEIYAEVGGTLLGTKFRPGMSFKKGEVLVQIEDREFSAQLKAQRSAFMGLMSQVLPDIAIDYSNEHAQWSAFASAINVHSQLPDMPELSNSKLKSFLSGRNVLNQYYVIKSQEERLAKHRIIAPYNGVLAETNIQPGTLVRIGQKLGLFLNPNIFELEAAVPETQLSQWSVGKNVQLVDDKGSVMGNAQVTRVNATINAQTQLVNIYLRVAGNQIKEGQYFQFAAGGATVPKSLEITRSWLSERNTIFAVNPKDSSLYELPVKVEAIAGDKAIVSGFEEGVWILQRSVAGAFEGMKVVPQLPKKTN